MQSIGGLENNTNLSNDTTNFDNNDYELIDIFKFIGQESPQKRQLEEVEENRRYKKIERFQSKEGLFCLGQTYQSILTINHQLALMQQQMEEIRKSSETIITDDTLNERDKENIQAICTIKEMQIDTSKKLAQLKSINNIVMSHLTEFENKINSNRYLKPPNYPELIEIAEMVSDSIRKEIQWIFPLKQEGNSIEETLKNQGLRICFREMCDKIEETKKNCSDLIGVSLDATKVMLSYRMANAYLIARGIFARLWERNDVFRFAHASADLKNPCRQCQGYNHGVVLLGLSNTSHLKSNFGWNTAVIDPCQNMIQSYRLYQLSLKDLVIKISNIFTKEEFDELYSKEQILNVNALIIKEKIITMLNIFYNIKLIDKKRKHANLLIKEIDMSITNETGQRQRIVLNTLRVQIEHFLEATV